MGMWTQKHHHCSISLTSRRLILTPQLFPGTLTHWHSIHPLWSHTDTNTEPSCELHKENHSCSEAPGSTSSRHTPTAEGLPRTRAGIPRQIPHHSRGEERKRLGCNICYQGFLHHSTAQLQFHMEHPRPAQHKIHWSECLGSLTNSEKLVPSG